MKTLTGIFAFLLAIIIALSAVVYFYFPNYLNKKTEFIPEISAQADEIKIMSSNVRCWSPTDFFKKSWFYRADLLIRNIEQENPSIIGFQEANKWQYSYLSEFLPGYDSVVTYRDNTFLAESCPIFYNTELYDLVDKGSFWLSETPEVMSKDWGSACYRICSYVILADKISQKQFVIFNTHLDHISDEARIKGIQVVLDKIEEFGELPSVIMGDFNADEQSETYKSAAKNFNDAKYQAKIAENIDCATYQKWGNELSNKPIDYFMISKSGFDVEKYQVVTTTYNGVYPSDHYPITVELQLK